MTSPALDFWNYPQWLGDSRDNPRDPKFEPFWMRDCAVARQKRPDPPKRPHAQLSRYNKMARPQWRSD